MNEGDNFILNRQYHLKPITFLISGVIVTGIFVCTLILNQNHTAMAQQEPNGNVFSDG